MSSKSSADSEFESETDRLSRWLQWAAWCIVGLTILCLFSARVPGRFRLLGLFALGIGCIAGFGMSGLAIKFPARSWKATLAAGMLIAIAEAGLTLETWRLYSADLTKLYNSPGPPEFVRPPILPPSKNIKKNIAKSPTAKSEKSSQPKQNKKSAEKTERKRTNDTPVVMQAGRTGDPFRIARARRQEVLADKTRFLYYLQYRVQSFEWSETAGLLFWLAEITGGAIVGGWVFHRRTREAQ